MFLGVLKRQNPSIYGKRTIISNFAISKTLNDASINYKIKTTIFIKILKIMLNFIGKRNRIKRNTLIDKINMGELELLMLKADSMLQKLHGYVG